MFFKNPKAIHKLEVVLKGSSCRIEMLYLIFIKYCLVDDEEIYVVRLKCLVRFLLTPWYCESRSSEFVCEQQPVSGRRCDE